MKGKFKKNSLRFLIVIIVFALVLVVIAFIRDLLSLSNESAVSLAIAAIEATGLLVSLIIAVRQLNDSKEISRASFVVELNKTFTESTGNVDLYTALQDCVDSNCENMSKCNGGKECKLDFPKIVVSNYLTFFETIYLLEKSGALNYEMIDDLFAYRFFLAVHSKFVQQAKLASQPENFKNIFCLEHEWMQYRAKKAHKIDSDTSVFKINPLKNLMITEEQKAIYRKWIKECKKF